MTRRSVLLFLKAPRPGSVKTRIGATVGHPAAAAIYRRLVERQLTALADAPEFRVCVHYAPADAEAEMRAWLGDAVGYAPQCDGDLGDRLSHAVRAAVHTGAEHVFCLGADCPLLGPGHLRDADRLLAGGADAVYGPTEDGGYYLLAQSAHHPPLFRDIPWSQPNTLAVSLARAEQADLVARQLPVLYDVDTESDWQRALRDLPSLHS